MMPPTWWQLIGACALTLCAIFWGVDQGSLGFKKARCEGGPNCTCIHPWKVIEPALLWGAGIFLAIWLIPQLFGS